MPPHLNYCRAADLKRGVLVFDFARKRVLQKRSDVLISGAFSMRTCMSSTIRARRSGAQTSSRSISRVVPAFQGLGCCADLLRCHVRR